MKDHSRSESIVRQLLSDYIGKIMSRLTANGKYQTLAVFKELHLTAMKIAFGRPFSPIPFLRANKRGIPRLILPLYPLLKGSPEEKRVALSITKLYLAILTDPSTDFSSITEPQSGDDRLFGTD